MDIKDIAEQAYLEGYDKGRLSAAQEIFKKVYSYTAVTEVGTRYLIRSLAREYGIELPRQLRKGLNGFEK